MGLFFLLVSPDVQYAAKGAVQSQGVLLTALLDTLGTIPRSM